MKTQYGTRVLYGLMSTVKICFNTSFPCKEIKLLRAKRPQSSSFRLNSKKKLLRNNYLNGTILSQKLSLNKHNHYLELQVSVRN